MTGPLLPGASVDAAGLIAERCSHVVDVDLARPLPTITRRAADGSVAPAVCVVARIHQEPLGLVTLEVPEAGLPADALGVALSEAVAPRLAVALDAPGSTAAELLAAAQASSGTAYSSAHAAYVPQAAPCSVVVCTREHPVELRRCLESLTTQDHPRFTVVVVDNAPVAEATRAVVAEFTGRLDVHYVLEPRPGLSRARNAALGHGLPGDVVAWLDDDEEADPHWLSEICRAFEGRPEVDAVSGVVVPAELTTQAQVWFEQFGGHSKGRGFVADEFSPATWARQHPLFPLPPFGVGANMAFRVRTLQRLGGFDEALGAGTRTQGSEDTKMFTDVLRAGGTTRYLPTALTRHYHRRDLEGLAKQMYGYGSGLTAFYLAEVIQRPVTALTLARLAPQAVREVFSSTGQRAGSIPPDFPAHLLPLNRRGMLAGPSLYVRERWAQARQARAARRDGAAR